MPSAPSQYSANRNSAASSAPDATLTNGTQNQETEFTYHVVLKNSDNTPYTNGFTLSDADNNNNTTDSNASNYVNTNSSAFDVIVTKHSPVTISNLPQNATFEVYEVITGFPSGSGQTLTSNVSATQTTGSSGQSDHISGTVKSDGQTTVTITNTYPQKRSLVLKKALDGAYDANGIKAHTDANPTPFTVVVTLTPPDGMSASTLKTNYLSSDSRCAVSGDNVVCTITNLKGDDTTGETISNLPEGTKYTVEESAASKAKTSKVEYKTYSGSYGDSIPANTAIGSSNNEVTVRNTYPSFGSLILSKTYADGTTEAENALTEFVYKVVLTAQENSGLNLRTYNYNNDVITSSGGFVKSDGSALGTDPKGSYADDGSTYTFYVKVKKGKNVTIGNIPVNTTYTVTETIPAGWMKTAKNGDTGTISGTASTASFTNAKKGDLNLIKALECVSDNAHDNKLFLYHVVLKAPTGMEFVTSGSGSEHSGNVLTLTKVLGANAANYGVTNESPFTYRVKFNHANLASSPLTVTGTGNSNIQNPVNDQVYDITVYPDTNVTISGMPDGTEYWVYEDASTPAPDSIKVTGSSTDVAPFSTAFLYASSTSSKVSTYSAISK